MLTRIFNFVKMSWMLTWRLAIPSFFLFHGPHWNAIVPFALVVSAVSVFALKTTLVTWPLLKLLQRNPVVAPSDTWAGEKAPEQVPELPKQRRTPASTPQYNRYGPAVPPVPRLSTASEPGRITGYEPKTLEAMSIPNLPNMIGRPGSGLENVERDHQDNMSAKAVALGKRGEENFARALMKANLLHRFGNIWSVPVPDLERFVPAAYEADIDCLLATGSTIYLVDLKNYKSGNVRYYSKADELYCEDVPTGERVGDLKIMTRNMIKATIAMRKHFPDAKIVPVVVFMPTDKGEGTIDNVWWPGGVRAMYLSQFLEEVVHEPSFEWNAGIAHAGVFARMSNLLWMREKEWSAANKRNR